LSEDNNNASAVNAGVLCVATTDILIVSNERLTNNEKPGSCEKQQHSSKQRTIYPVLGVFGNEEDVTLKI
jgi:hypothetical protein